MGGGAWGSEALAGVWGGDGEAEGDDDGGSSAASSHESATGAGTRGLDFGMEGCADGVSESF